MAKFTGLLGLIVIILAAFLFSTKRSRFKLRIVIWGMGLQFAFAFLVLKTRLRQGVSGRQRGRQRDAGLRRGGSEFRVRRQLG